MWYWEELEGSFVTPGHSEAIATSFWSTWVLWIWKYFQICFLRHLVGDFAVLLISVVTANIQHVWIHRMKSNTSKIGQVDSTRESCRLEKSDITLATLLFLYVVLDILYTFLPPPLLNCHLLLVWVHAKTMSNESQVIAIFQLVNCVHVYIKVKTISGTLNIF